jgi:DNA phosphorothioation-dependent restriction protein DptG
MIFIIAKYKLKMFTKTYLQCLSIDYDKFFLQDLQAKRTLAFDAFIYIAKMFCKIAHWLNEPLYKCMHPPTYSIIA